MIDGNVTYMFPHEKLEVWQQARELAKQTYKVTAGFPKQEKFGLVDQLRRAAVSVMSNLAEGSGRTSARDQAHFSQMAFGSLMEMESQLQLSLDLGFLAASDYERFRKAIHELAQKTSALRSSQLKRCSR